MKRIRREVSSYWLYACALFSAHACEGLVVCFDVRIGTDGLLHVYVWRQWLDGSGSDRLEVILRSVCCVYSHSRNIFAEQRNFLVV